MVEGIDVSHALAAASQAALRAGQEIRRRFGSDGGGVEFKGAIDVVTEADRAAEDAIVAVLGKATPGFALLLEEQGLMAAELGGEHWDGPPEDAPRWIVDPLDGTTNFFHGFPVFSVSIALQAERRIVAGVIYDVLRGDLYHAAEGQGAWQGGRRLSVSDTADLGGSLLATGFPYDRRVSSDNNVDRFSQFITKVQGIRRCGSAALDLAMVARGALDGYWEAKLKPWDVAAGVLLVAEAGGTITGFYGEPVVPEWGRLVASNGQIHGEMVDLISGIERDAMRGPCPSDYKAG